MSHFAQRFPDSTVGSFSDYAVFATRVDLGSVVRASKASPVTYTIGAFVVGPLGSVLTFTVNSATDFVIGDFIMIGTRGMYLSAPVHATTGPGALAFNGRYFAGRSPSADATPAGLSIVGPSGQYTTITAPVASLPDWINVGGGSASISVADRAQIPSGGRVLLTNYAGVYKILNISGNVLTAAYVIAGDLPAGATCVVDQSGSDIGTAVTQFYPIGTIPKGMIFCYEDATLTCVSASGTNSVTPNISLGYVNAQYTSGPVTRFGEYIDNTGQQAGTVLTVNAAMPASGQELDTSADRHTPMDGMTFGLRVNAPSSAISTSHVVDVCVRGWLFPMQ